MSMAMKYAMKKRMAHGGRLQEEGTACEEHGDMSCRMCHGGEMAQGGEVHYAEPEDGMHGEASDDHELDMVDRAIRKYMSRGGKVSMEHTEEPDFEENEFDDLPKDDDLEFHETGANEGDELGDEQEDEDRRDLSDRAMMRYKKQKNPRPA